MAETYRRSQWSNGLFILPYLLVFIALLVFPLFWGMWLSLHKVDLFGPGRFVGLTNYIRVAGDAVFLQALGNTIVFVLVSVPTLVALGLFLALALNRTTRTTSFFRGLFFSSSVLSVTIVTLIWRFVFIPGDGLLSVLFTQAGIEQINFISTKGWSLFAVGVATVWWCVGLPMMLFSRRPAASSAGPLRGGSTRQCQPMEGVDTDHPALDRPHHHAGDHHPDRFPVPTLRSGSADDQWRPERDLASARHVHL